MENENLEPKEVAQAKEATEPHATAEAAEAKEARQPPEASEAKEAAPLKKTTKTRSKLILGGTAVLVAGMFLGFAATKYGAGVATATAATRATKGSSSTTASRGTHAAKPMAWNPFQEMRDMQLHMDQMFNQMVTDFRTEPRLNVFADNPGYSLSFHVRDMKDHYEVRAYLPDAKASDVKTSLLDNQTLKVEVSNKVTKVSDQKGAKETISEWGQYAQIIHLPGPVKNEEIKIDQPNHQLLIDLPKA
jgi:HSP20 family molecular chaperone IbpA